MKRRHLVVVTLGISAAMALAVAVQQRSGRSPFNGDRAFADLKRVVEIGPRPAGSPGIAETRGYILDELRQAGLDPVQDEFVAHTPVGPIRMVNIRARISGRRADLILLGGHYDTKVFDFPFVGASDAGSSTAFLLEMARIASNLKLEHTLELIFFDGEEAVMEWTADDSIYGSRHDVERRREEGSLRQVKAMVLVDMIGDKDLNIRQEAGSARMLNTIIWDVAHRMGYAREFLREQMAIEDDHLPYLRAGIPAVDIIDFDYPYWHTAADTLDKTSARSLKIVGDVVFGALPVIDERLK